MKVEDLERYHLSPDLPEFVVMPAGKDSYKGWYRPSLGGLALNGIAEVVEFVPKEYTLNTTVVENDFNPAWQNDRTGRLREHYHFHTMTRTSISVEVPADSGMSSEDFLRANQGWMEQVYAACMEISEPRKAPPLVRGGNVPAEIVRRITPKRTGVVANFIRDGQGSDNLISEISYADFFQATVYQWLPLSRGATKDKPGAQRRSVLMANSVEIKPVPTEVQPAS